MKLYIVLLSSFTLASLAIEVPILNTSLVNLGDYTVGPHIVTEKGVWNQRELLFSQNFTGANLTEIFNTTAYGLTERTGIQISIPIVAHNKSTGISNNLGLEDIVLFGQWHFYKQESNMAIINLGIRVPTRTVQPRLGEVSRTTSYIFDVSGVHSSEHWFAAARAFIVTTPEYHFLKPGNYFFYTLTTGPQFNFHKGVFAPLFIIRSVTQRNNFFDKFELDSGISVLFFGVKLKYKVNNVTIAASWRQPVMQTTNSTGVKFEWISACSFQIDF